MDREELIRLKKEYKYSAKQLSDLTGVPVGTLTKILSGETKNPRVDTMRAIEDFFARERKPVGDLDLHKYDLKPVETLMVAESAIAYGVPKKEQGTYTVDDLECLPEGRLVELIDGVLYDRAAPTLTHQEIIKSMFRSFDSFIDARKGPCRVCFAPVDVYLDCDKKTDLLPDLFVVCDKSKLSDDGVNGPPDFILEVISPSTEHKDKIVKAIKYLESGVREYWIIDPYRKQLIVYRYEVPTTQILQLEGTYPVGIFDGELEIDLDQIREITEEFS